MARFLCAAECAETETVIEKSRFIARAVKAESEDDARDLLAFVKKLHPFATHNCYAYIVDNGAIARFSDDGEPQGTAGMPILEVVKARGLVNTAVVVTRYFGGIKLGAGGLVRAYSGAAAKVLDEAGTEEHCLADVFSASFGYDLYPVFLKFAEKNPVKTLSSDFGEEVTVSVAVKEEDSEGFVKALADFTAGKIVPKAGEKRYEVF